MSGLRTGLACLVAALGFGAALRAQGVPVITSLSPPSAAVGGGQFSLAVSGSGFLPGASVRWNGQPLETSFVSVTQLAATVPATLTTQQGTATVTVVNPGGSVSNTAAFIVTPPPAPLIDFLTPQSVVAGSPQFNLIVNGYGYVQGSVVRWNTQPLATTVVDVNELSAVVPAALVASPGLIRITVANPDGQVSNALTLAVESPAGPALVSLTPSSTSAGLLALSLTVSGTGFQPGAAVAWNGRPLSTFYASPTQMTGTVPGDLLATPGTAQITVVNPNGAVSNALPFTVRAGLQILSLSPSSAPAGGPSFALTVNGSGFFRGSIINWGGQQLPTVFVSSTALSTVIPASLLAQPGAFLITVTNPDGVISNDVTFTVRSGELKLTALRPPAAPVGSPDVSLQVVGSGFLPGAVVLWNSFPLATAWASSTVLVANLPGAFLYETGVGQVSVLNADGSASNSLPFSITNALTLTALSPASIAAGSPGFVLTLTGSGFSGATLALWNGTPLPANLVSETELAVSIPPGLIAQIRPASVAVMNPATPTSPATTSNSLGFSITGPVRISGISPQQALSGKGLDTLTVNGTGFVNGSVLRWNDSPLTTTLVSSSRLTAAIPPYLTSQPGTATLNVVNPDGGVSNSVTFTIIASLSVTGMDPVSALTGDPGFTLTVNGTAFVSGAVIGWGDTPLRTRFVSSGQLQADVPASLLRTPGMVEVAVVNADKETVSAGQFTIVAKTELLGLEPGSATAGSAQLVATVNGSGFAAGAVVRWNGSPLTTFYLKATQLIAVIPDALLASAGSAWVQVANPDGQMSNIVSFTINFPLLIRAAEPARIAPGGPPATLALTGQGFVPGAVVQWNTTGLATTYVNATRLTAVVPAELIVRPGSASVSVRNPDGKTSNTLAVTVGESAVPDISLTGLPGAADPGELLRAAVSLGSPLPLPVTGKVTLEFQPGPVNTTPDDPQNVSFEDGTRVAVFSIPAGSLESQPFLIKPGTVAGAITVSAEVPGEGGEGVPALARAAQTVTIAPLPPRIDRACAVRTPSGFDVVVIGYSTPREVAAARFRISASGGTGLSTEELSPTGTRDEFNRWFQSQPSFEQGRGGTFKLVQPFSVPGNPGAVQSISVMLTNGAGQSEWRGAAFEDRCPDR